MLINLNVVLHNDHWEPWLIKKAGAPAVEGQPIPEEKPPLPITAGWVIKNCLLSENKDRPEPMPVRIRKYELADKVSCTCAKDGNIDLPKTDTDFILNAVNLFQPLLVVGQIARILAGTVL